MINFFNISLISFCVIFNNDLKNQKLLDKIGIKMEGVEEGAKEMFRKFNTEK